MGMDYTFAGSATYQRFEDKESIPSQIYRELKELTACDMGWEIY